MKRSWPGWSIWVAVSSGVWLLLAIGCAEPESETVNEEAPVTEASAPVPGSQPAATPGTASPERRPVNLGRRPFWHEAELIEVLGLDDAQLSIMETRRQAVLDKQREKRQVATALRAELSQLMEEGAWDQARELTKQLAADAGANIEADVELKISVLERLSPEQRQRLMQERPSALRRSWLIPGGRRANTGPNPLLDGR